MKPTSRPPIGLGAKQWQQTPEAVRHALLCPAATNIFQVLDVGLTTWEPPGRWREVYERSTNANVLRVETEHGKEVERNRYNIACLARAGQTRQSVLAEHSGFSDLFVPVCSGRRSHAVLVTGPFLRQRPTSADVLERWRKLSKRQADPSDPEFERYLSALLGTLVLEGSRASEFVELVELLARLMALHGQTTELISKIDSLGRKLIQARLPERTWTLTQDLVDARASRAWASASMRPRLEWIGLKRYPERVLVGLFVNREKDADRVDEVLRRDAFQRAAVELAHQAGSAAGRVGSHGITLLALQLGSETRTRRHLQDLAQEAASLASKRFGLDLHVGTCAHQRSLSEQYQTALAAAEAALSKGLRLVELSTEPPPRTPLGPLRQDLRKLFEENPVALPAQFERYIEAVATRSQYRFDLAQAHLEAGFELIANAVRDSAVLDAKNFSALGRNLERAVSEANTIHQLFAAYRGAMADVVDAIVHAPSAQRDRNLRLAQEYVRRHFAEPLTLARVARVAGFTPSYFSQLFHKKVGITLEHFILGLRVQRAEQLLLSTTLSVQRVAQLTGFKTPEYLARAFKKATGQTPSEHRRRAREETVVLVHSMRQKKQN